MNVNDQDIDMLATYGRAQEYIDQGVCILQRWPDKAVCDRLIEIYFKVADAMIPEQVVLYCHEKMWSTFGDALGRPRSIDKLSAVSRELCRNAMWPLAPAKSTQEWMDSFSGLRLRWEIVGNLLAAFGFSAMTLSDVCHPTSPPLFHFRT